jgi:hypothetical protein
MNDRRDRLRKLEDAMKPVMAELLRQMKHADWRESHYVVKDRRRCGEKHELYVTARYCEECRRAIAIENQRTRRHLRAGLILEQSRGDLRFFIFAPRECEFCGERFNPKRTTARYCSPKCRVYAHRIRAKPS